MNWYCQDLEEVLRTGDRDKVMLHLWYHRAAMQEWLALPEPVVTDIPRFAPYNHDTHLKAEFARMAETKLSPEEARESQDLLERARCSI
jgi:hypothetical protein